VVDPATPTPKAGRANAGWAVGILVLLFTVYHLNGDLLPGNDAKPNVYLALSLLDEGNLTFTPSEMPFMFVWDLDRGERSIPIYPRGWDERFDGRTLAELRAEGRARLRGEKYYIVPTIREGRYVSMYGPGAGLAALPALGALRWIGGDPARRPRALWYTAKGVASLLVAGAGALLFLTALVFTTRGRAVLLALAYGIGTSAWCTSSQTLWQHGPNVFFLALGTYFLSRLGPGRSAAAWSGLAYACAVICRPNSALILIAVGVYLMIAHRRHVLAYAAAATPPLLFLAAFNAYHFGSPLRFGQTLRGEAEAQAIAGSGGAWQTPLLEGLAGHLVSPSRGLLVFSPFLIFALWGAVSIWRNRAYASLRPLTIAVAAILLLSSKWYYWWGGWSFGYRLIVDLAWFLVLFLVPTLDAVFRRKWLLGLLVLLVSWSVGVQVLGAFAYNLRDWNARPAGYVVQAPDGGEPEVAPDLEAAERLARSTGGRIVTVLREDVNDPAHRHRLWSWKDNQILHYVMNFGEARRAKREMVRRWLDNPAI
jgi:hypothetical protein